MIVPVVLYVCDISGMAERTMVELTGDRKPHTERTAVITIFRDGLKRSY